MYWPGGVALTAVDDVAALNVERKREGCGDDLVSDRGLNRRAEFPGPTALAPWPIGFAGSGYRCGRPRKQRQFALFRGITTESP